MSKSNGADRYQQILLPCKGTSSAWHNKVVATAKSIVEMWDNKARHLYADQLWHIVDTKSGKVITPDEFYALVNRLKGWN